VDLALTGLGAERSMALPIFKSDSNEMGLMQTAWATQLNPLIANPICNGKVLKNVELSSGANVINHLLGRKLQGWILTRQRSSATIYDTQDANKFPELTLQLTSSAAVVVDIYVF